VHVFDVDREPMEALNARLFHGVIEEAAYVRPHRHDTHLYRLRLRPRIHSLAYRVRSRIFQEQSIPDIFDAIIGEAGLPADAFDLQLASSYAPREYVTQWKESELDFLLRWLEELGIHFFFQHGPDGHVMVLSDRGDAHDPIPGNDTLTVSDFEWDVDERDGLRDVVFSQRAGFESYAGRDWNFMTPDSARAAEHGESGERYYESPGRFVDEQEGAGLAVRRAEALVARQLELRGRSNCRRLESGKLVVVDAVGSPFAGTYLVTSTRHTFNDEGFGEGDTRDEHSDSDRDDDERGDSGLRRSRASYRVDFDAVPEQVVFRPPRIRPWPRISGKESAVVTGPSGEEIHVDPMGRIKVHFYWDREGAIDDTASCWMRVQQLNTAGAMILPRVGWEVQVGFLNGDPDRPVVLQKLYNQEHMPPYPLPASLMKSTLQSSSSPGGGGTNEIDLDDQNGAQRFFVHAQKDYKRTVGHDAVEKVGVDATLQVGIDRTHKVGGAETISVGGAQGLSVTGVYAEDNIANKTVTVGGLDSWGVGAVHTVTTEGARTDTIGAMMIVLAERVAETFNAAHTLTVGAAYAIAAGGPFAETTAGSKIETVGAAKVEVLSKSKAESIGAAKALTSGAFIVDAGGDVNIAAQGALAITAGGAFKSKCGGSFGISSGGAVTVTVGTLSLKAGSKLTANGGSIKLQGGTVGGNGGSIKLKGTVKYK
jgi:type VI secretion system secreted protein VgrG